MSWFGKRLRNAMVAGGIPMNTFGERLKEAMAVHGLSQRELAERIGTHETVVSHYVRGTREPGRRVLADILNALPYADARELLGCRSLTPNAATRIFTQAELDAEREACARLCDELRQEFDSYKDHKYDMKAIGAEECAAAIRAR